MSPEPNKPERHDTDFSRLPQSPTDFDRTPDEPAPPDPIGERLLWVPVWLIVIGVAAGALTDLLGAGHTITVRGLAWGAGAGAGLGIALALFKFFRVRTRERDSKFAGPDPHGPGDADWAGARDVMRRQTGNQEDTPR